MLLLFAGGNYYPEGGWGDFIKVIGSLEELEIREEHTTRISTATRRRVPYDWVVRHINVTQSGTEYDWWHVVDTDTMAIVVASHGDGAKVDNATAVR